MAKTAVDPGLRQALEELQLFLSDQLAPLMVVDSVEKLLQLPPELVARQIRLWVDAQLRGPGADVTLSDYLFHAAKKIHLMSEFELIPQERLDTYLQGLGRDLLELCPPEDREALRDSLGRLDEAASGAGAAPVEIVHRHGGHASPSSPRTNEGGQAAGGGARAPAVSGEEIARNLKRFGLLVERLEQGAGQGQPSQDVLNHLLTSAAVGSSSDTELEQHMSRLSRLGIDAGIEEVFRSLGNTLSGWAVPESVARTVGDTGVPGDRSIEAMRRIVTSAADPEESARRFHEMVRAATEQFNDGRLVQSMKMFALAEQIVTERRVDPEVAQATLRTAHELLSQHQLRTFAENPERHEVLRVVLSFFPALRPPALLVDLNGEPRRDRRKLLLALLEVHGSAARAVALEQLDTFAGNDAADPEGYFQRNLLFLLRRIPRDPAAPLDAELGHLDRLSKPGNALMVIKEAIGALGQLRDDGAARILTSRLQEYEQCLVVDETASDFRGLLDRTVAALALCETSKAARSIVRHAFTREPRFGDTMARLGSLGSHDLAFDAKLVAHLADTLRKELPTKVLGFVVQKQNDHLAHLVRSLSSTRAATVEELFRGIVKRFPDQHFSRLAARALESWGAQGPTAAETQARSLSGDIELFGLPNLLQTLADSKLTGVLSLADSEGQAFATLTFERGGIQACNAGRLTGETAFYQLFEKPNPGTFSFNGVDDEATADGSPAQIEVLPAILEALRRYDEFQQSRVIVPDEARLKPTGTRPSRVGDEDDTEFMRAVWQRASDGVPPSELEDELEVDAYRVRRLYASWVEAGALAPA